nr:hypothetical protein [Tanacetum cinerariifolium]
MVYIIIVCMDMDTNLELTVVLVVLDSAKKSGIADEFRMLLLFIVTAAWYRLLLLVIFSAAFHGWEEYDKVFSHLDMLNTPLQDFTAGVGKYRLLQLSDKIVSQLAILSENISQEDLNMKFLRSLPSEWNTHVVVWRNKADLDTMSIDDLYNNFKIVEQEVKRTITSRSSSGSQNMAFLSSPGSTNEVDTASIQVSNISTPVSTVSSHDNTANLSDAPVYAFLANQPNGSQPVHEDLEQIYEDDLEEMDLKWQLALLSMRAKRSPKNQEGRPSISDNSIKTVNVEDTSSKAMVAIDGAGFDWSYIADDEVLTNMALMAFSDSEKRGLAIVEEQLVFYKKNEVIFCDQIVVLKKDASFKDSEINALNLQIETLKKEKRAIRLKLTTLRMHLRAQIN